MYGCLVKVRYVSSWHTLLYKSSLVAQLCVVICNLVCQCCLLHVCDVYHGDVPSVIPDVHLVAIYFHYPVGFCLVSGLKGFSCVAHCQDEVPWLHWRLYWLLAVMFLHVLLSAVEKLLGDYLVDVSGRLLSSWKYLLASCTMWLSLLTGSLPNIRKNVDSQALQLGKKF